MDLHPGARLAHYEIVRLAGRGGMGEVYAARDGKLDREIAIKILPPEFTLDADRLMRFDREAHLLAALNHPNIAAIYGFEEFDGTKFLVMEMAGGETLADRIARGPLPMDECIDVARQIADALEAAHDKGIIHRDLKPANVKVDDEGRVKVLDFGLAKALEDDASPLDASNSPTMVKGSHSGMILGTAAYMSPEQARGKRVDRRTDIWAFGVVLWEMLTGKRAFEGETVTDTLISIATREPEWADLPSDTPEPLRRLLRRCLSKTPRERLRDIADARLELLEAMQAPTQATATQGVPLRHRTALAWALPILLLLAGIAAGFAIAAARRPVASVPPVHGAINLPPGTQLAGWGSPSIAISPDGNVIAFVANRGSRQELYLRRLDEFEAKLVAGSDGAEGPFFSPDGQWVAFGAGRISGRSGEPPLLKKAPVSGEGAQPVCAIDDYFGGTWGDDGWIYFSGESGQGLWRVSAAGGSAEPVRLAEQRPESFFWPQFVPGGRILAVREVAKAEREAVFIDPSNGRIESANVPAMFARLIGDRLLAYVRLDGSVHLVPFSIADWKPRGTAAPILSDVALSANGAAAFAVSGNGTAIWAEGYVRGSGRELRQPAVIQADGRILPLDFPPDDLTMADLSPDHSRLVAGSWRGELWIYDLQRKTRAKLPFGETYRRSGPIWTPDGNSVIFNSDSNRVQELMIQSADGSDRPRKLLPADRGEYWPGSFSPDGRHLIFFSVGTRPDQEGWEVWLLPLDNPAERRKLADGFAPRLSPDGRWLAYESVESGSWEVYLQSFPSPSTRILISQAGGKAPSWSAEGRRLYYWAEHSLMTVEVKGPAKSDVGLPSLLFEAPELDVPSMRRASRLMPIEDGFIALAPMPGSGVQTQLKLAVNWLEEAERKIARQ